MKDVEIFPYRSRVPGEPLRPLIDIFIENVGTVLCILDSGADVSTFPAYIGELAGVNIRAGRQEKSECAHGDETITYVSMLKISVKSEALYIPVNFILNGKEPALIGRAGFFDRLEVIFDEHNKRFILKKRMPLEID